MSRLTAAQQRKQQFAAIQAALRLAFDGLVRRYGLGQSLGNCCQKIGSGSTPRGGDNVYVSEGIPFIRSLNVRHFTFRHEDLAAIPPDVDATMKGTRVLGGDVLLNITGASIGRSCCAPFDICPANVSQHVCIIRPEPDVYSARFVMYWLNSDAMQRQITEIQKGATRQGLTKKQIEEFRLPAVPPSEQKALETLFESILAGVMVSPSDFPEHLRDVGPQINKVQALANKIEEAKRLHTESADGFDDLCRSILRSESHGQIRLTPMNELVTLRQPDVAVQGNETYHFAGVYCFGGGVFIGQRKTGLEFKYPKLTTLHTNDFVYPKLMAWEGAMAVVPPECDGLVVSTEYPVFEVNQGKVLPEVLDVYFRTSSVWPAISGSSTGTNVRRRRLNPADFLRYKFPLPPRATQEKLRAIKAKAEEARKLREPAQKELDAMLPAILDRAFRGELTS